VFNSGVQFFDTSPELWYIIKVQFIFYTFIMESAGIGNLWRCDFSVPKVPESQPIYSSVQTELDIIPRVNQSGSVVNQPPLKEARLKKEYICKFPTILGYQRNLQDEILFIEMQRIIALRQ
jgi:hypothetical protein